jgi:hypothetical protein
VFCIACGTRLPDEAAYCSACGRATHRSAVPERAAAGAAQPAEDPAPVAAAPSAGGTARTWSEAGGIPFLWNGRWWSRGPSGEVVVWDATSDNWDLALSTQTPFFMRRPRFTSLRTPTIWTSVLLGFFALFTVLAIAADIQQAYRIGQLRNGETVAVSDLELAHDNFLGFKGLQMLAAIGAAPLFIWWLYRAARNLPAFGALGQEFSPGWTIGWWFVPGANLVQPLRVLLEAWRGSAPRQVLEPDQSWKTGPAPALPILWWIGCLAGTVGFWLIGSQAETDVDERSLFGWAIAAACIDAALLLLTSLTIVLIWRLARLQQRANQQFDVPSGSVASAATGPSPAAARAW